MSTDTSNVVNFPSDSQPRNRAKKDSSRIKNIDGVKYFNEKQIKTIRRAVRDQSEIDEKKGNVTGIKEWMVIDLTTSTGLRVSEAANLRCGDLKIGYSESKIFIRDGKCSISGHVIIPDALEKYLKAFLSWNRRRAKLSGMTISCLLGNEGHGQVRQYS